MNLYATDVVEMCPLVWYSGKFTVKCAVVYLSESVIMFQIQGETHSGVFVMVFGIAPKSEPNAQ